MHEKCQFNPYSPLHWTNLGFHLCQRTRCFKCTFLKIYVKWDNFKFLLAFFFFLWIMFFGQYFYWSAHRFFFIGLYKYTFITKEISHFHSLKFTILLCVNKTWMWDFSGGPMAKNLPAKAENTSLIPGPGWSCMLWNI